jgi:hypothetical protein
MLIVSCLLARRVNIPVRVIKERSTGNILLVVCLSFKARGSLLGRVLGVRLSPCLERGIRLS